MLSSSWSAITQLKHDATAAYNANSELLQKYQSLYDAHDRQTKEFYQLNNNYYSLYEDWENSQKLVNEYAATLKKYADTNHEVRPKPDSDAIIIKLETKIKEMEKEREDMVENHRNALIIAADRICAVNQKMDERAEQASPCPTAREDKPRDGPTKPRRRSKRGRQLKLKIPTPTTQRIT